MAQPGTKKKRLFLKLKNKYRLVVMNDDTFEEKASLRLSPMNVFVVIGSVLLIFIIGIIYLIAFTPLREYIPGYGSEINNRGKLEKLAKKADSLEKELYSKDQFIANFRNVMEGNLPADTFVQRLNVVPARFDTIRNLKVSREDSLLRKQIESGSAYEISVTDKNQLTNSISNFFFFPPLKGTVTNTFDAVGKHYGVDIVAPKNEAVKATLDGTVIFASWTTEAGNVIAVQHTNNLVSVYKHNATLLKKPGDDVKAGEVIAFIGDSGELTTGPHLHFELWYNGRSVNPSEYIALK